MLALKVLNLYIHFRKRYVDLQFLENHQKFRELLVELLLLRSFRIWRRWENLLDPIIKLRSIFFSCILGCFRIAFIQISPNSSFSTFWLKGSTGVSSCWLLSSLFCSAVDSCSFVTFPDLRVIAWTCSFTSFLPGLASVSLGRVPCSLFSNALAICPISVSYTHLTLPTIYSV